MTDKPVRFVSSARGQKVLTVELAEGHSAEEVLALLNEGKAILGGDPMQPGQSIRSRVILPSDQSVTMLGECEVSNESSFDAWEIERDKHSQCRIMTPAERDRNQADNLARQAHHLIDAGKVHKARALLKAARALIRDAGTRKCAAMITVYTAEGNLATKSGRHDEGVRLAQRTCHLARQVLGQDDPTTILCVGNIGEALLDAGRREEALPYLKQALTHFREMKPVGNWTREWIDANLIPKYEKLLADSAK